MRQKRIIGGVYLVADGRMPADELVTRVTAALRGGVQVVQLWSPRPGDPATVALARRLVELAHVHGAPLLVADDLDLAVHAEVDGVHLDSHDIGPAGVRAALGEKAIVGVTCGADLDAVVAAAAAGTDYISFCSIFPSPSAAACELVPLGTVRAAREMVQLPIFAAGGITLENAAEVLAAGADGLALISAVLRADDPAEQARRFKALINTATLRDSDTIQRHAESVIEP